MIAVFLERHARLRSPTAKFLDFAAAVRAAAERALPGGLVSAEPGLALRAARSELLAVVASLEELASSPRPAGNEIPAAIRRVHRALSELRIAGQAFAPPRTTTSPAARAALFRALDALEVEWPTLQDAAEREHVRRLPWQIELAAEVAPGTPVAELAITGHALPRTPAARRSWGERCWLSGTRYDTDSHAAPAVRFRSLDRCEHVLSPESLALLQRLRDALDRVREVAPDAVAELARGFPALYETYVEERWNPNFGKLGILDFPALAVALNNMLRIYGQRPLFGSRSSISGEIVASAHRFATLGAADPAAVALSSPAAVSGFQWETFDEARIASLRLACAFARLGLGTGARIGLIGSENCRELCLADFAAVFARLVSVGIFAELADEALAEIAKQTAVVAVVADEGTCRRCLELAQAGRLPALELVVAYGGEGTRPLPSSGRLRTARWDQLLAAGAGGATEGVSASGIGPATGILYGDSASRAAAAAQSIRPDAADEIYTILFTSGSTGAPKGTVVTCRRWAEEMCLDSNLWPQVSASFLPPSTAADRASIWRSVYNGGRVGFARRGAALFADLRAIRPTILDAPPVLWNALYNEYKQAIGDPGLTPSAAAAVHQRFRELLGGRLAHMAIGGAPSDPEVRSAMERIFGVPIVDGYGTTETGNIGMRGLLLAGLDYRLVDVPELSLAPTDQPCARGELAVRTARTTARYHGEADGPGESFTADGYFLTGDLVEIGPGRKFRILGRRKSFFKLAGSEFVSPEALERLYGASERVESVLITAPPLASAVVAVVVPAGDQIEAEELLAEFQSIGRRENLRPAEIPRAVIVEPRTGSELPWSVENGLLTPSLKLHRRALEAKYRARIEAAYGESERVRSMAGARTEGNASDLASDLQRLRAVAAAVLSRPLEAVDPERSFLELGGDSLAAMELALRVEQVFGGKQGRAWSGDSALLVALPLAEVARQLGGVSRRSRAEVSETLVAPVLPVASEERTSHGEQVVARGAAAAGLANDDAATPIALDALPARATGDDVLLTGATGFLGVHLLAELAASSPPAARIYALVRADDDGQARHRLERALLAAGLATPPIGLPDEFEPARIVAVAGHLERDRLGLAPALFSRLAERIGLVFHLAAKVSATQSYRELRDANAVGTRHVLDFVAGSSLKTLHYVSSLNVTYLLEQLHRSRADEETPLTPRLSPQAVAANLGYTISKWVSESLVQRLFTAAAGGLRASVSRPALITWSAATGYANDDDWLSRVLASCLEIRAAVGADLAGVPGWVPETAISARGLDLVPVDFVARAVARLGALTHSGELPPASRPALGQVPTFHLSNLAPGELGLVTPQRLMDLLVAADLALASDEPALRYLPFSDWMLEVERTSAPAVRVLSQLRAMTPALPRIRAERFAAALPPVVAPPIDRALVEAFVRRHRERARRDAARLHF